MKITLRAAVAAIGLASVPPAFAGDSDGPVANSFFTELPGVIAQAPVQNAPAVATAQLGRALQAYVTQSRNGTWLFQPNGNQGSNS